MKIKTRQTKSIRSMDDFKRRFYPAQYEADRIANLSPEEHAAEIAKNAMLPKTRRRDA
jgi:hypothetical protein